MSVTIYNPVLDTWITGTPLPAPRANMVVGVINGRLRVASGSAADGTHDTSVLVYDPIADKWHPAPAEPTARYNAAAAVIGSKLFVAGGNTDSGPYTSTAEVFTPARPDAVDAPRL